MYFINTRKISLYILAMLVLTVNEFSHLKTVGYLSDRYRLVHWWVSEMMLNVQSVSSIIGV